MSYPILKEAETAIHGPKGIGGWLGLMAIAMPIGLVKIIINASEREGFTAAELDVLSRYPGGLFVAHIEAMIPFVAVGVAIALCILFFGTDRRFVGAYIAAWLFYPVFWLLDLGVVSYILGLDLLPLASDSLDDKDSIEMFGSFAGCLIWVLYLINSRRVANTFVE